MRSRHGGRTLCVAATLVVSLVSILVGCSAPKDGWGPDGGITPTDLPVRPTSPGRSCEDPNHELCAPAPEGLGDEAIPGSYLILADPAATATQLQTLRRRIESLGGVVRYEFELVKGFAVEFALDPGREARALNDLGLPGREVVRIEPNRRVHPAGVQTLCDPHVRDFNPWRGLDQCDGRCDGFYDYSATGQGVTVYLLDTRIAPHPDLTWSADFGLDPSVGYSAIEGSDLPADYLQVDPRDTYNQHGTLVAGVIAGRETGVAKRARIIPVRVLDASLVGSGRLVGTAAVIRGLDWVTRRINARVGDEPRAVVLMNFSTQDNTLHDAGAMTALSLRGALDCMLNNRCPSGRSGVVRGPANTVEFIAPGGNQGPRGHIANYLPGGFPGVHSVGALNVRTARDRGPLDCARQPPEGYSNRGAEWWAPGTAWSLTQTGRGVLHGTSAAAAYAAGLVALHLERALPLPTGATCEAAPVMVCAPLRAPTLGSGDPTPLNFRPALSTADDDGALDGVQRDGSACHDFNRCVTGSACSGGIDCPRGADCDRCGEHGRRCCQPGSLCDSGWTCLPSGTCGGGGLNQRCRPGNRCDAGLRCSQPETSDGGSATGVCLPACGGDGQPCCDGTGCGNGLTCQAGTCVACGGDRQPCCGRACGNGLACVNEPSNTTAPWVCRPCGGPEQHCCNSACNHGLTCYTEQNLCIHCGGRGERCCGTDCVEGYSCSNGLCGSCGDPGERCCDGTTPCSPGSSCVNGVCGGCGAPGQHCCQSGTACREGATCAYSGGLLRCVYCCIRCRNDPTSWRRTTYTAGCTQHVEEFCASHGGPAGGNNDSWMNCAP